MSIKSDREELFKDVVFLVEATDFEHHMLWLVHHYESEGHELDVVRTWDEEGRGHEITVGEVNGMPVVVSLTYAWLEGKRVCFYYTCSRMADSVMVEKWLRERTKHITWDGGRRWGHEDAQNFHLCLDAIRQAA